MKVSISGIRGIYGKDLTLNEIYKFSTMFSLFLKNSKKESVKCIVARDTRHSGEIIKKIVISSLLENGIDVYDMNISPTPVIFRESRKFEGAIIITASHNPINWNGIKFILKGRGLFEYELKELLSKKSYHDILPPYGTLENFSSTYSNELLELLQQSKDDDSHPKKIGIDGGGGATCCYVEDLFKKIGHITYVINGNPSIISRGPDPTTDNLIQLKSIVKSCDLDYGFSFDLDGDRLVVVSNNGQKLNSDSTLLLCIAKCMNIFKIKNFVTSLDTSNAIDQFIKNNNGNLIYSKVGEANVVQKILETNADAGGEGSSAGFIMSNFNWCRDGILASILISTIDQSLFQECMDLASNYSQIRDKMSINMELQDKMMEKLQEEFKSDSTEIITIDGIKIILDNTSWILFRSSNTENALRISIESNPYKIKSIYRSTINRVKKIYDQTK